MLRGKLEAAESELERLRTELARLTANDRVHEQASAQEDLQQQLAQRTADLARAERELGTLRDRMASAVDAARHETALAMRELDDARAELTTMRQRFETLAGLHGAETRALQRAAAGANESAERLRAQVAAQAELTEQWKQACATAVAGREAVAAALDNRLAEAAVFMQRQDQAWAERLQEVDAAHRQLVTQHLTSIQALQSRLEARERAAATQESELRRAAEAQQQGLFARVEKLAERENALLQRLMHQEQDSHARERSLQREIDAIHDQMREATARHHRALRALEDDAAASVRRLRDELAQERRTLQQATAESSAAMRALSTALDTERSAHALNRVEVHRLRTLRRRAALRAATLRGRLRAALRALRGVAQDAGWFEFARARVAARRALAEDARGRPRRAAGAPRPETHAAVIVPPRPTVAPAAAPAVATAAAPDHVPASGEFIVANPVDTLAVNAAAGSSARWYPRTVDELLTLYDEPFVRAAYRALLGREADPSGLDSYGARVRAGVPRERVLVELASSEEGRKRKPGIPGLDELLRRHGEQPGRTARAFARLARALGRPALEPVTAQLNALQNLVWARAHESELRAQSLEARMHALASDTSRRLEMLQGSVRALAETAARAADAASQAPRAAPTERHAEDAQAVPSAGATQPEAPVDGPHLDVLMETVRAELIRQRIHRL